MRQTTASRSQKDSLSAAQSSSGHVLGDSRFYTVVREQTIWLDAAAGRAIVLRDRIGHDADSGARVTDRVVADLVHGEGHAFGWGTMRAADGDRIDYAFVGRVEHGVDGVVGVRAKGTWVLTGGTGPWRRRTGHGAFVETALGPRTSMTHWRGRWQSGERYVER